MMQSQIKFQMEKESRENVKQSIYLNNKTALVIVDEIEDEPLIEDAEDDFDTSEHPLEASAAINPSNFNGILTQSQALLSGTNKIPSSIVNNSMASTKNKQLGYHSPVKKLFQLKFTGQRQGGVTGSVSPQSMAHTGRGPSQSFL